ncbi:30S ribosomal protein S6 [Candidatus Poribacteria bacterium]|nr:30S ribosomal protein S6 [Candidatus Poribacteria bacterium]MYF54940.1 30S ribosomal protein S6 [Candidatus Poribacteria bacterium]MYI93209.1 30S ribosomal protein S6 [Candidatus Poribacteria bacterium]
MKPYELMLIITPDQDESQTETLIENVKGIIEQNGNIVHIDNWGKRRLSYPIRKRTEGYYVIYVFECETSFVAQLNQALRVNEAILRHMIVLFEDDLEKLKATPDEETDEYAEDATESIEDIAESEEENQNPDTSSPESA